MRLKQAGHLADEKRLLLDLVHPFIMKWFELCNNKREDSFGTFQDGQNLYFVLEYLPGGEIYDVVRYWFVS